MTEYMSVDNFSESRSKAKVLNFRPTGPSDLGLEMRQPSVELENPAFSLEPVMAPAPRTWGKATFPQQFIWKFPTK